MLKVLIKKQMMEIFRSYFYDTRKNKGRSKISTIILFAFFVVVMVGILGGMFSVLAINLCVPLAGAGVGWLYFLLMGVIAIILGAFGSIFSTYAGLYLAKDNDLLLSMPIPVRTIITARLAGVYLMGLIYSAVVMIPTVVIYWIQESHSAAVIIGGLLMIVLVSVFVLVLSTLLGWGVARISLKLKNKSAMTVIISLAFIAAYYLVYFKAMEWIRELIANAVEYAGKVRGAAYGLYLFGRVGEGSPGAMILFIVINAVLFVIMWLVIERSFVRITTSTGAVKKAVYKEKTARMRSIDRALFSREASRFTSSANYMLNCGLGVLILPAIGILFLLKGGMVADVIDSVFGSGAAAAFLPAFLGLAAAMNDITAPSVSLEGKTIWIAQSLPVAPLQILRAKLRLNLIVSGVPMLFAMICTVIILPDGPVVRLLAALLCMSHVVLLALWGLFLNLKLPNLGWTNEAIPIKQSASVMAALFGGWIYIFGTGLLFLLIGSSLGVTLYLLIILLMSAALSALLYIWIRRRGTAVFAAL